MDGEAAGAKMKNCGELKGLICIDGVLMCLSLHKLQLFLCDQLGSVLSLFPQLLCTS